MIFATVSSRSCFCWLYTASPSLASQNVINLIFGIGQLVMSMYKVISCVVEKGYLLWQMNCLGRIQLALPHFILFSKAKLTCYSGYLFSLTLSQLSYFGASGYLLTSYFRIPIPYEEKDIFYCASFRSSCRSSWNHSTSASLAFVFGA